MRVTRCLSETSWGSTAASRTCHNEMLVGVSNGVKVKNEGEVRFHPALD